MEPRTETERRFTRETGKPHLAEAAAIEAAAEVESDTTELLTRLERQAAESGRLDGRVRTLEHALGAERAARRRLADTLKRERRAAETLSERAERAEAAHAVVEAEAERLRLSVATSEQQLRQTWPRLLEAEHQLALRQRPLWRRLFRRPPTH